MNMATIAPMMQDIAVVLSSDQPVGVHASACQPQTTTTDTARTDTIEIAEPVFLGQEMIPSTVRHRPHDCQMDSPHESIEDRPEWAIDSAMAVT